MIDFKNKIIFIHIPKTGGTAIERYFARIRRLHDRDLAALFIFKNPDKRSALERGMQHCSLGMYESLVFGGRIPDDFRLFTVVREPEERFWSEWRWRRLPPTHWPLPSMRLSVRALIWLSHQRFTLLKDLNSHMRPQSAYLEGVSADRVRVLRHESLDDEFQRLVDDWGLPQHSLERSNVSPARTPSTLDRMRARHFVFDHYACDFERFGYPTPTEFTVHTLPCAHTALEGAK